MTATVLNEAQLETFDSEGYVCAPVFQPGDLDPLKEEIAAFVNQAAQRLFSEGTFIIACP